MATKTKTSTSTSITNPFSVYTLGSKEVTKYTDIRSKFNYPQDFLTLRSNVLSTGSNFEDLEFPHDDNSIGGGVAGLFDTAKGSGQQAVDDMKGRGWDGVIRWKRIKDIIPKLHYFYPEFDGSEKPQFAVGCAQGSALSKLDVRQGFVGTCWFLAAVASVATDQEAIDYFIPQNNCDKESHEAGIFHFKFWYQGLYIDIVVDDYLPVLSFNDGEYYMTISAKINKNDDAAEFWTALAEKAFAKLNGSYKKIAGGYTVDAFEAITGGFANIEILNQPSKKLHSIMTNKLKNDIFLALSCSSRKNGLKPGHAYSITQTATVHPYGGPPLNLVRIRNPWGEHEWTGEWSDSDNNNWSSLVSPFETALRVEKNDGEFWMTYEEMLKCFSRMFAIRVVKEKNFSVGKGLGLENFHGKWSDNNMTNGGAELPWQNPQFLTKVSRATNGSCYISIGLSYKCKPADAMDWGIGLNVYRVFNETKSPPFSQSDFEKSLNSAILKNPENKLGKYEYLRSISQQFNVEPGTYLIVPYTNDPNGRDFCARIITTKK